MHRCRNLFYFIHAAHLARAYPAVYLQNIFHCGKKKEKKKKMEKNSKTLNASACRAESV